MAENSKIEWCDSTFNPWIGCTKVSPGCDHCYAERDFAQRKGRVVWGAGQERSRTKTWGDPLKWEGRPFYECQSCGHRGEGVAVGCNGHGRACEKCDLECLTEVRRRVFCASLADVFDNEAPAAWRAELFALIGLTPHLDWLLLTKRIGNVLKMMDQPGMPKDGMPSNVWLGATVVNQEEADRDIPKLLAVPARVRFLSIEPMLGPVDLGAVWVPNVVLRNMVMAIYRLDWVICGGESGPKARPMQREWARSLRDQCESAGVPFLFKQWGEWRPTITGEGAIGAQIKWADGSVSIRAGKKLAGRRLDGLTHDQFPESV